MTSPSPVKVGEEYRDHCGRVLVVTEYHPAAPDGRVVVGRLLRTTGELCPYATDAAIFRVVWVDKLPPVPESEWHKPGGGSA